MDIPMELSRILITELGEHQVIFLKEKDGSRNFPILIGISEAMAIDRRLKDIRTPRPLTHDLLADIIEKMGGRLEKIVINDLRDHTFIATLHIRSNNGMLEIDSRPSDAIALGVAFDTPIYAAEHVLATVTQEPSAEDRVELLRRRMELLADKIAELTSQLADEDFLHHGGEEEIKEHRRMLDEMQKEYDAIEHVLKKLG